MKEETTRKCNLRFCNSVYSVHCAQPPVVPRKEIYSTFARQQAPRRKTKIHWCVPNLFHSKEIVQRHEQNESEARPAPAHFICKVSRYIVPMCRIRSKRIHRIVFDLFVARLCSCPRNNGMKTGRHFAKWLAQWQSKCGFFGEFPRPPPQHRWRPKDPATWTA